MPIEAEKKRWGKHNLLFELIEGNSLKIDIIVIQPKLSYLFKDSLDLRQKT